MNQENQENKSELDLKFIQLTIHNRKTLEILVNNCFPITYTQDFYRSVPVLYKDFGRLIYLKEIPVAGILCRIEDEKEDKDELENLQDTMKNLKLKKDKKDDDQKKNQFLHLMIILVLKDYRRLGIAKQIMQFIYKRVKEVDENIQYIKLHVLKSNESAIKFYINEGFDIVKTIPNHYELEDGQDSTALLMQGFLFFDALNQICQIEKKLDKDNIVQQCGATRFFYTAIFKVQNFYELKISSLNYTQDNLFQNFFNNNQIFSSILQFTPKKIFVNGQIAFILSDQDQLYVLGIDNQQTGLLGFDSLVFSVDNLTQILGEIRIINFVTCPTFNMCIDDKNEIYFWGTLIKKHKKQIIYKAATLKQDYLNFETKEIFISFYQDIFLLDQNHQKLYEVFIDKNLQIRIKNFRKIEENNKIKILYADRQRILYQVKINKEKIVKQIYKLQQAEIFIKSSEHIQYRFRNNYLFVFNFKSQTLEILDLNKKYNQEVIFSYKFKKEINIRFNEEVQLDSANTICILPVQFYTDKQIQNLNSQKFLDIKTQTVLKFKSDLIKQQKNQHKNFFEFNYSYVENNVNIKMKTENSDQSFSGLISNKSKELKISGTLLQNFSFSRNQNNFQDKLKSLIDIFNTNQTNKCSNHQNEFKDRINKCKLMIQGNTKTIKNISCNKNDFQGFREKIKNLKLQQIQTEESFKDQSYTCSLIFDQDHNTPKLNNKSQNENKSLLSKNKIILSKYFIILNEIISSKRIKILKNTYIILQNNTVNFKLKDWFIQVYKSYQYNSIKLGIYQFSQQYIGLLMVNNFEKFFKKQKQQIIIDIIYISQLYKKLKTFENPLNKVATKNAFTLIKTKKQQYQQLVKLLSKLPLYYQVKKLEIIKHLKKLMKNRRSLVTFVEKICKIQKKLFFSKLKQNKSIQSLKISKNLEKLETYNCKQSQFQLRSSQNDINKPQIYQIESVKGSLQDFINSNSENLSKVDLSYIRESLPDTEFAKYCEYLFDYKERIKMTDSSSQFSKPSDIDVSKKSVTRDSKKQFYELVNKASFDKDFSILNNENLCTLKNYEYQNLERENTPQIKQQYPVYSIDQSQQINNLSEIKEENSSLERSLYSNLNEKRVSEKIKHVFKKQNKTPEIDIQETNQECQQYNKLLIKNLATLKSNIKKLNTENSNKDNQQLIIEQKQNETEDSQDYKRVDVYLDTQENENEEQKRQSTNSNYQKSITFKGLRDIAKIKHYNQKVGRTKSKSKKYNSSKSKSKQKSYKYPNFSSQRSIGSFNNAFKTKSKQSLDFKKSFSRQNILSKTEKISIPKDNDIVQIKNILQQKNQIYDDTQKVDNYITKEIQKQQNKTNPNNINEQVHKPSFSMLKKQFSGDLSYSKPVINRTSFVQHYRVSKNDYNKFKQINRVKKNKNQQEQNYIKRRCGSANFTNKIQRN